MALTDESLAELFEQYKEEVRETIGILDSELVAIEQDATSSEVIFSLFRHLHSLKGSSKMFNVDNISHIAHKLEDLMQLIDKDNTILQSKPKIVDLLFRGNDIFRDIITRLEVDIGYINLTPDHAQFIEEINRQLEAIQKKENPLLESARNVLEELESLLPSLEEHDIEGLRRSMADLTANIGLISMDEGAVDIRYTYGSADLSEHMRRFGAGLEKFRSNQHTPEDIEAFLENAEGIIQVLFDVAEEDIMEVLQELNDGLEMYESRQLEIDPVVLEFFASLFEELKSRFKAEAFQVTPDIKETPPEKSTVATRSDQKGPVHFQAKTIRVDEKKIDLFLESVGRLITQSEILNHLQYSFIRAGISSALIRDFAALNRTISNDIVSLQRSIMEVRQVEMDNILKKFPRLVRDISHKMGKEVMLMVSGERTPLDKSLLEDVEQALIHIVRNSIDHGLENPAERERAGKDVRGRITIDVVQEETSVLIVVSDDGRGLDLKSIRQRSYERGLITREQYESMTDLEVETLVYESGLTTKKEATDISGRGVGLDVVRSNISKWNGEILMQSRQGQGLTIKLRLPITNTLLTKEAILLKLGQATFCLPLEFVMEIVTVPEEKLHHHRNQVVFQHRNQVISVVDIKGMLGLDDSGDETGDQKTFIILKGQFENRKAIVADMILGQQKIVIKDFEVDAFRRLPHFQGLTLLGDGRVVLVIDAERLVD